MIEDIKEKIDKSKEVHRYNITSSREWFENLLTYITNLQQENKQLKEQLENDIDRYEDTISYQLGFDKGKEYLQQRIDNAINYIKWHYDLGTKENVEFCLLRDRLLEILGDKENE